MINSNLYWENRYKIGGNSGAGSYNNLAKFKSDVINNFIKQNNIENMIDYGMGDGNLLKMFNINNYIGLDVSKTIINKCKKKFVNKLFFHINDFEFKNNITELCLSSDVIYHLIEEDIFNEYLKNLFKLSKKYVIIYAWDINLQDSKHVYHRKFTDIIKDKYKNWKLINYIKNPYPQTIKYDRNRSNADFYIYKKLNNE